MSYRTLENESLLVKSLSKGDLLAFNTLYKEYSGRLYRFAFGYLKIEAETEELIQEVFTLIWEKRADLREELSFKSYLFTITYNLIKKHFRTRSYLRNYLIKEYSDDLDFKTTQEVSYNSLYQYITELVNQLPERRREIFAKSRFEGHSIKEISEEMNISHKTVENQLSSALKFLRTKLNHENVMFSLFFILYIS